MDPGEEGSSIQLYIMITLLFLACYLILSAFLQHKKYPIHRSTVAIIVGIIAGLLLYISAPSAYQAFAKLDQIIIFSVLYPPMIFAQGYTLHKSVLFKNFKYILLFGLLGTFISFLFSWGLIFQANQLDLVRDTNDIDNFRSLSSWQILLLSACLCSIDTTASEESVCEYKYPRLYSMVFGENILKDAVTIVLFDSILSLQQHQSPQKLVIYWYTFFQVLLNFIILVAGSVALGLVGAFLTTFLNKKMRFLALDGGTSETGLLFLMGFFIYISTQMLDFSGSISLLLYGVLLNHYNIYNMSEQSRSASVCTFTLISNICEGALFLIMGIMVWQGQWESPPTEDSKMTHSYIFFFIVMLILFIARFVNVYVLGWLSRLFTKGKFSICNQQMHILFLGGLVRGAVPFVLFSSVSFQSDNRYVKNEGMVLKTTIIFVIISTSVIMNSLFPLIYRRRVKHLKRQYKKLFGESVFQKEVKSSKYKNKLKQLQQKYIKSWLILDYEERKEMIKQQKKRRLQSLITEAMREDQQQNQQQMLTEQGKNESLIN